VLTALGQPMPVRRALEQADAETLLELAQVTDHGRLTVAEHPRGPAKAAGLCDREKDAKIVPLHGAQD